MFLRHLLQSKNYETKFNNFPEGTRHETGWERESRISSRPLQENYSNYGWYEINQKLSSKLGIFNLLKGQQEMCLLLGIYNNQGFNNLQQQIFAWKKCILSTKGFTYGICKNQDFQDCNLCSKRWNKCWVANYVFDFWKRLGIIIEEKPTISIQVKSLV